MNCWLFCISLSGLNLKGVQENDCYSIAMVGMRNIRDYKGKIRKDTETMGSASPFNIVSKALTLKNFTREEIQILYSRHTEETVDRVYWWTDGQPWLVNAIALECIEEQLGNHYTIPVTQEMAKKAVHTIILRCDVHIDSLLERLHEERVRKVVEPVILGYAENIDYLSDDFMYCMDLGLIKNRHWNHQTFVKSRTLLLTWIFNKFYKSGCKEEGVFPMAISQR